MMQTGKSESTDTRMREDPPRAFAQGTGVLLQFIGAILFVHACCACSSTFLWDPQWSRHDAWEFGAATDRPPLEPAKFGLMLMVMFTTLGGLAMMVFGLGLQSEKPRSAWGALATHVLLLGVLCVAGVCIWTDEASVPVRLWHGLLSMIVAILTVFCIQALRQVLANPPPGGFNVMPADEESGTP